MTLDWKVRRRRSDTNISRRWFRDTKDQRFTVVCCEPKLSGDIGPYYLALEITRDEEQRVVSTRIISRHRTEDAAIAACEMVE